LSTLWWRKVYPIVAQSLPYRGANFSFPRSHQGLCSFYYSYHLYRAGAQMLSHLRPAKMPPESCRRLRLGGRSADCGGNMV
jgi:hypothetical protein